MEARKLLKYTAQVAENIWYSVAAIGTGAILSLGFLLPTTTPRFEVREQIDGSRQMKLSTILNDPRVFGTDFDKDGKIDHFVKGMMYDEMFYPRLEDQLQSRYNIWLAEQEEGK